MGKTKDHIDYQIRKTTIMFAENRKPNRNKRKTRKRRKNQKPQFFGAKTEKPIPKMVKTENPNVPSFRDLDLSLRRGRGEGWGARQEG